MNMAQMKEQDKSTAKDLHDMEISNVPNKTFRVMGIERLNGLMIRVEDPSKELENIKITKQK